MSASVETPPPLVDVRDVSRRFGDKSALRGASLTVPRGGVFGLIGGNGAGKTTLIKHLLGMYRPQSGTVRVFGRDPVADPVGVLGRIGYLSEERDLPGWMSVEEFLNYTAAFFPGWDERFARELREAFELDPRAKIRSLSRGQRARTGLLAAIAHRPDLLVLDEPSSGLDPVVRRDILGAIIRTIADEGRTVLFSSHLLDEVERVADRVAIIHEGEILLNSPLDHIKESHGRLTLRFPDPRSSPPVLGNVLSWTGAGAEWTAIFSGDRETWQRTITTIGATVVNEAVPTLDEIFVSRIQSSGRPSQQTPAVPAI